LKSTGSSFLSIIEFGPTYLLDLGLINFIQGRGFFFCE
jgi:hypothetical protein